MIFNVVFLTLSGSFAILCLFYPKTIILIMYRISIFLIQQQGHNIPENYQEDYQSLRENPKDHLNKFKSQIATMRGVGVVCLFLFLSSICLFSG